MDHKQLLESRKDSQASECSESKEDLNKKRAGSIESLDRMYTFSLRKNPKKKVDSVDGRQAKQGKLDSKAIDVADSGIVGKSKQSEGLLYAQKEHEALEQSSVMQPATSGLKAIYVGESIKVLQSIILKADPVLNELCSLIKEF